MERTKRDSRLREETSAEVAGGAGESVAIFSTPASTACGFTIAIRTVVDRVLFIEFHHELGSTCITDHGRGIGQCGGFTKMIKDRLPAVDLLFHSSTVSARLRRQRPVRPLCNSKLATSLLDGSRAQTQLLRHLCQGLCEEGFQELQRQSNGVRLGWGVGLGVTAVCMRLSLSARANDAHLRGRTCGDPLFHRGGELQRREV
mmetsp:Transcript_7984/g.15895  ORF Transcript_7984/g.15895 Transcript_7984/m.15895 type:complete len:202 (+) Transcript_7984:234-839(+)